MVRLHTLQLDCTYFIYNIINIIFRVAITDFYILSRLLYCYSLIQIALKPQKGKKIVVIFERTSHIFYSANVLALVNDICPFYRPFIEGEKYAIIHAMSIGLFKDSRLPLLLQLQSLY